MLTIQKQLQEIIKLTLLLPLHFTCLDTLDEHQSAYPFTLIGIISVHKCTLKCRKDIPDKRYKKYTKNNQAIEINCFIKKYNCFIISNGVRHKLKVILFTKIFIVFACCN